MSHGVVIRAHNGTTRSPATRRRSRHAAKGAVTQRVGLGPMRSRPVMKLSTSLARQLASAYERLDGAGRLCARLDGFDLHGRVASTLQAGTAWRELVRYCARPPVAYDRLTKQADGRYQLRLKIELQMIRHAYIGA
jgi:hypothetical protein